jgi:NADPH:quinone reductase-like Zn-dependent oxidoreductase
MSIAPAINNSDHVDLPTGRSITYKLSSSLHFSMSNLLRNKNLIPTVATPQRRFMMHTSLVKTWGQPPTYTEVDTPPTPPQDSDLTQVKLIATGLHRLVKARAAGTHYSATTLPHIPGVDGVGTTSSGQQVYFSTLGTGGSFSEIINVPNKDITPLPEGVDPMQVAALANPAISSWSALKTRTFDLPDNFTVVINGVTTASGNIAINIARAFGAGKVIGVARNAKAMEALDLDERITLCNNIEETDFAKLGDVDVVLDYLWGTPAVCLLKSLKSNRTVQFVQIGSMAGAEVALPGSVLRSKDIVVRGSGPGAWKLTDLQESLPGLLLALKSVPARKLRIVKLSDVEKVWNDEGERMVFVPEMR